MKIISNNYDYQSRKDGILHSVGIGDIHVGFPYLDDDLLYETIEYIYEHDNARWIGMGDYIECITPKDNRFDLNNVQIDYMSPQQQIRKVIKMLEPIKEKCIGVLHGNHEYKHWLRNGHNYASDFAIAMDAPYVGKSGVFVLKFKRKAGKGTEIYNCFIYAHHGWTGARTETYKVKSIHDLYGIVPMLDLYLMGHVHKSGEMPDLTRLAPCMSNPPRLVEKTSRFVFTGSYAKGYNVDSLGSYVEEYGYPPTSLGSPIIRIKPNRRDSGDGLQTKFFMSIDRDVRNII